MVTFSAGWLMPADLLLWTNAALLVVGPRANCTLLQTEQEASASQQIKELLH